VKKVRINLKKNVDSWSFVIYDSVESAFYLKNETLKPNDMDFCKIVSLGQGDVLEAEWMGSEYVYLDESAEHKVSNLGIQHEKYEKVRVGKLTTASSKASSFDKGGYVELYVGWIPAGCIEWSTDDTRDDLKITQIKGRVRSRMVFGNLFVGHPDDADELSENYPGLFSEVTGSRGTG
jgi:hypothetical protein